MQQNLDRFKFRVFVTKHNGITINKMYYQTRIDHKYAFPAREDIGIFVGTTDFCRQFVLREQENGCCQFPDKNEIIIMQSTGIKDRNGQLIYEGDILKRYDLSPQEIEMNGDKEIVEWGCGSFNITFLDGQCSEIIGNIYENPELI